MLTTFQQHIMQEQKRFPGEFQELQWIASGISLATKLIQDQVRRAGLVDILGAFGAVNVQGETQQKLDVFANETLIRYFSLRESIGIIASEENEHPIVLRHSSPDARYAIVFDPLDGSSNIDVAVTIGTTFSILRRPRQAEETADPLSWVLQPGSRQVVAGYVLYGSSTVLVYSVGNGVHAFTLEPAIGSYILTRENIKMPAQGDYYSVNEAYCDKFLPVCREYLQRLKSGVMGKCYSSRHVGSMVADFHRTLLRGGIFMYPATTDYPKGKLRLLYEANPVAFLAEQAGGAATDGEQRILDLQPHDIHQRTPLIVGGETEMTEFERCVREAEMSPVEKSQNSDLN